MSILLPYARLDVPLVRTIVDDFVESLRDEADIIDNSIVYWEPALSTYAATTNASLDSALAFSSTAHELEELARGATSSFIRYEANDVDIEAARVIALAYPPAESAESIAMFTRLRNFTADARTAGRARLNGAGLEDVYFDMFAMSPTWRFRNSNTQLLSQIVLGLIGSNALVFLLLLLFFHPGLALMTWLLVVVSQLHTVAGIYLWRVVGFLPSVQLDTVTSVSAAGNMRRPCLSLSSSPLL